MAPGNVLRPQHPKQIHSRCTADAAKSRPLWVGTDVLKALAGRPLANLVYTAAEFLSGPPPNEEKHEQLRSPEENIRCAEVRAARLLQDGRVREALTQLETILITMGNDEERRCSEDFSKHTQRLAASAISWAFDMLVTGPSASPLCEAFESLCLAENLTRVALCGESPTRLFLRSLCLSGLGTYYWLRKKPQASLKYLVQAASKGHGRWVHPAILLNLASVLSTLHDHDRALEALNEAILSLRSSVGSLFEDQAIQTEECALDAICNVIDSQVPESAGFTRRIAPGEQLSHSNVDHLQKATSEISTSPVAGSLRDETGLELHFSASELAVSKALYTTLLLLKPWPALHEGKGELGLTLKEPPKEPDKSDHDLWLYIVGTSLPGPTCPPTVKALEQAVVRLRDSWPLWAKPPASNEEVPGAGLLLRELIAICFFNTGATMSQVCTPCCLEVWLLPVLQQGLALTLNFFDSKHPLALLLRRALRKAAKCAEMYRSWLAHGSQPQSRPGSAATGRSPRVRQNRPISAGTPRAYSSPRTGSSLGQVIPPSSPGTANSFLGSYGFQTDATWDDDSGWDVGLVVEVVQEEADDSSNQKCTETEHYDNIVESNHQQLENVFEQYTLSLRQESIGTGSDPLTASQMEVNVGTFLHGTDTSATTPVQDSHDLQTKVELVKEVGSELQQFDYEEQCTASPKQSTAGILERLYPQVRGSYSATEHDAFALAGCSRVPNCGLAHGNRHRVAQSPKRPVRPSPRAQQGLSGWPRIGAPPPINSKSPSKSPRRPIKKALAEPVLKSHGMQPWPLNVMHTMQITKMDTEIGSPNGDAELLPSAGGLETKNPLGKQRQPFRKAETWGPVLNKGNDASTYKPKLSSPSVTSPILNVNIEVDVDVSLSPKASSTTMPMEIVEPLSPQEDEKSANNSSEASAT